VGLHIAELVLGAPAAALGALERFYGHDLGLPADRDEGGRRLEVRVGPARLAFEATTESEPFYHFALLVPGDRFDAAYAWLAGRAEILPRAGSEETVFDFSFWDALACYCLDPAGNILELIAHRGLGEDPARGGPFAAGELLGISEIGLVTGDPPAVARALRDDFGLELWSGDLEGLAFVGRKAHTLILSRPGRGWLPTGRPAEPHPLEVGFAGGGRVRA
jgi:hypothetical protein